MPSAGFPSYLEPGRLSERSVRRRVARDVARDREYLERIPGAAARRFARENPDAGREDYFRFRERKGGR